MDRNEALDNALKKIEKDFGKGAIMRLGDAKANMNIEVIPTGILPLDVALGVGGVPRGRIIEIYGPESSGKTTVTLHMIAEAQKNGGIAAFIDAGPVGHVDGGFGRAIQIVQFTAGLPQHLTLQLGRQGFAAANYITHTDTSLSFLVFKECSQHGRDKM